jgi:hypothetical protein
MDLEIKDPNEIEKVFVDKFLNDWLILEGSSDLFHYLEDNIYAADPENFEVMVMPIPVYIAFCKKTEALRRVFGMPPAYFKNTLSIRELAHGPGEAFLETTEVKTGEDFEAKAREHAKSAAESLLDVLDDPEKATAETAEYVDQRLDQFKDGKGRIVSNTPMTKEEVMNELFKRINGDGKDG